MNAATLATAMGCSRAVADRYVAAYNVAMIQAGCTTRNRAAMFAAQLGHESAGFRYFEEIASGAAYEGRRDLGNTQPGDGRRFKGRGPIQVTGRANYTAVSRWAHGKGYVPSATYFVDHPAELASDRYGFLGPVWYWTVARPTINPECDQGDVHAVTRLINGGLNGIADRLARYARARALGARILPDTAHVPAVPPAAAVPRPTRRPRGDSMLYFETPEPEEGQEVWDWPTVRIPFPFDVYDPEHSWGGDMIVKVDHGGRGGWIHALIWWVRDDGWSANRPTHHPVVHPVGAARGHAGSERFVGFGWESRPPRRADFLEIVTSAPDGVVVRDVYQR